MAVALGFPRRAPPLDHSSRGCTDSGDLGFREGWNQDCYDAGHKAKGHDNGLLSGREHRSHCRSAANLSSFNACTLKVVICSLRIAEDS